MQSAPWAARLPALMKQHSMHSASASLRDQLQRIQRTSPACFIQFQESSMLLWAHSTPAPAPSPSRFILFIHLAAHDIASLIENWRIKQGVERNFHAPRLAMRSSSSPSLDSLSSSAPFLFLYFLPFNFSLCNAPARSGRVFIY